MDYVVTSRRDVSGMMLRKGNTPRTAFFRVFQGGAIL
jgi:hypothetical protein